MTYGYARVSTLEQNPERQEAALREAGCDAIYTDKASGKDLDRPRWKTLFRRLRQGDTLIVKSIDRLGRNYRDILDTWRELMKLGVGVVVLDMPLLDTRGKKDLTGQVIADIVLQLLSYVAETERAFIRQRQAEGIAMAKARGVRFGPLPKQKPPQFERALREFRAGECSARDAAKYCEVSHKTFLKWAKEK